MLNRLIDSNRFELNPNLFESDGKSIKLMEYIIFCDPYEMWLKEEKGK